ncbi:MAG: glycosyltransferase family 4 protein [Armatimonadetes bacterium]|nr:glycosyltransferase family 4 protein [Armatimonadota bacterium]
MSQHILVWEPQCSGFEYAPVNAALLEAVALAFPEARITFRAEEEHSRWVRDALPQGAAALGTRVRWRPVAIPPRSVEGWRRVRHEFPWVRSFLAECRSAGYDACILGSVARMGLFALKQEMRRAPTPPILAVLHSELNVLAHLPRHPLRRLLCLDTILALPHPPRLHYIALGESILEGIRELRPRQARRFHALDLPYLLPEPPEEMPRPDGEPVRFGFFGSAGKGFEPFCRLAAEVTARSSGSEWWLVGFAPSQCERDLAGDRIRGVSPDPLPLAEYARRATSITYSVMVLPPHAYRLRASASFIDTLAYGKPVICLRNPYVASYFARLGDLGYLCDSLDEMRDLILRILSDFPRERYQQQCANARAASKTFSPPCLAPQLRQIIERITA